MAKSDATASALSGLFAMLGIAVLEREPDGSFSALAPLPEWFAAVWPGGAARYPDRHSPVLEHFLEEATECWRGDGAARRQSGLWTEVDQAGGEHRLMAWAVRADDRALLLVNDASVTFQAQSEVVQQAREQALVHGRLVKEIERKDVLLHSIVHDLRSPMVAVHSTLQLLDSDGLDERDRRLVQGGLTQLQRQDRLIRTILDVFAADVRGATELAPDDTADLVDAARETMTTFTPTFELRGAHLRLDVDGPDGPWWVRADRMRLLRVFANLVENALRHSRPGRTVTVTLHADGDEYEAGVNDQGPGVTPERAESIFDRFARAGEHAGTAGLGLHFCRITIEAWGGRIGQVNRDVGGARFWFRLPSASTS